VTDAAYMMFNKNWSRTTAERAADQSSQSQYVYHMLAWHHLSRKCLQATTFPRGLRVADGSTNRRTELRQQ